MTTITFPKDTHPSRAGQDWSVRTSAAVNEILFYGGNASAAEIEALNKVMWDDGKLLSLPLKFQAIAKLARVMIRSEAMMLALMDAEVGVSEPSEFVFLALQDIFFMQGFLTNADAVNAFERKLVDNPTPHPGANEEESRLAMRALEKAMVNFHPQLKNMPLGSSTRQAQEMQNNINNMGKTIGGQSFSAFNNYSYSGMAKPEDKKKD